MLSCDPRLETVRNDVFNAGAQRALGGAEGCVIVTLKPLRYLCALRASALKRHPRNIQVTFLNDGKCTRANRDGQRLNQTVPASQPKCGGADKTFSVPGSLNSDILAARTMNSLKIGISGVRGVVGETFTPE